MSRYSELPKVNDEHKQNLPLLRKYSVEPQRDVIKIKSPKKCKAYNSHSNLNYTYIVSSRDFLEDDDTTHTARGIYLNSTEWIEFHII